MSLRHLKERSKPVFQEGPDGEEESVKVYGLNLDHLSAIVDDHFDEGVALWSLFDGSDGPNADRVVYSEIARLAPMLIRRVLLAATRSTELEDIEALDNVSLFMQWDIIQTCMFMTFGRKNWLPGLIGMVRDALVLVRSRRPQGAAPSAEPLQQSPSTEVPSDSPAGI